MINCCWGIICVCICHTGWITFRWPYLIECHLNSQVSCLKISIIQKYQKDIWSCSSTIWNSCAYVMLELIESGNNRLVESYTCKSKTCKNQVVFLLLFVTCSNFKLQIGRSVKFHWFWLHKYAISPFFQQQDGVESNKLFQHIMMKCRCWKHSLHKCAKLALTLVETKVWSPWYDLAHFITLSYHGSLNVFPPSSNKPTMLHFSFFWWWVGRKYILKERHRRGP